MAAGHPALIEYRTFVASAARTTSGTSTAFDTEDWDMITVQVNASAASGATPTLAVRIQSTYDDGATWTDLAVSPADLTAAGRQIISTGSALPGALNTNTAQCFTATDGTLATATLSKSVALGTQIRFSWAIGGATPSFTFAITGVVRRLA